MSIIRIVWRRLPVRGSLDSGGSEIGVRGLLQMRIFIQIGYVGLLRMRVLIVVGALRLLRIPPLIVKGFLGRLRIRILIVIGVLGLLRIPILVVMSTRWLLYRLDRSRIRRVIASRVSRRLYRRRLTRLGVISGRVSRLRNIASYRTHASLFTSSTGWHLLDGQSSLPPSVECLVVAGQWSVSADVSVLQISIVDGSGTCSQKEGL